MLTDQVTYFGWVLENKTKLDMNLITQYLMVVLVSYCDGGHRLRLQVRLHLTDKHRHESERSLTERSCKQPRHSRVCLTVSVIKTSSAVLIFEPVSGCLTVNTQCVES